MVVALNSACRRLLTFRLTSHAKNIRISCRAIHLTPKIVRSRDGEKYDDELPREVTSVGAPSCSSSSITGQGDTEIKWRILEKSYYLLGEILTVDYTYSTVEFNLITSRGIGWLPESYVVCLMLNIDRSGSLSIALGWLFPMANRLT